MSRTVVMLLLAATSRLSGKAAIDGAAPVVFPGDPAVFPRPDLKPPPPGLPLQFAITPSRFAGRH